jgi:CheY-like chemotaxis protein
VKFFSGKGNPMLKPILLVEDKADDRDLITRALKRINCPLVIQTAETGKEAIAYVRGEGLYADRQNYPIPVLILMDLQLPDMKGTEIIQKLRAESQTRWVPMILITGNEGPGVASAGYRAGASAVLGKPYSLEELEQQMTAVCDFWLRWSRSPTD